MYQYASHPLAAYWHERRALAQACAWLAANDPDRIVAEALWRLNRHAWLKGGDSYHIYWLKEHLLRAFYHRGFQRQVTAQRQALACRACGGSGVHGPPWDRDACWHCHGTGVYKIVRLLCLRYQIAGRAYTWHAPEDRVTWLPEADLAAVPTDPHARYQPPAAAPARLTPEHVDVLLWVCKLWLAEHGRRDALLPDPPLRYPSLLVALRAEIYALAHSLRSHLRSRMRMWREQEIPF